MGPGAHGAMSLGLGSLIWSTTGSFSAGAICCLAGTAIDADHLLDYVLSEGPSFRPEAIASGSYFRRSGRAIVFLHSYELVLLGAAALCLKGRRSYAAALLVGALAHIASDAAFYGFTPLCYSLVYRIRNRFSVASFKPGCQPDFRKAIQNR